MIDYRLHKIHYLEEILPLVLQLPDKKNIFLTKKKIIQMTHALPARDSASFPPARGSACQICLGSRFRLDSVFRLAGVLTVFQRP
jgi:hypothetical protein